MWERTRIQLKLLPLFNSPICIESTLNFLLYGHIFGVGHTHLSEVHKVKIIHKSNTHAYMYAFQKRSKWNQSTVGFRYNSSFFSSNCRSVLSNKWVVVDSMLDEFCNEVARKIPGENELSIHYSVLYEEQEDRYWTIDSDLFGHFVWARRLPGTNCRKVSMMELPFILYAI